MKRLLCIAPVLLALLSPTSARADTLGFDGTGKGVWGIDIGGVIDINNVFAGEIDWTWVTTPPAGFDSSIVTYCVDVLHDVTNPEDVTVKSTDDMPGVAPNVPNAGQRVAWLYNTYAGTVTTDAQAAGLQIAIWEALYDTTTSLTSGAIYFGGMSADVMTAANNYLTGLAGATLGTSAVWLDSPTGQDQITNVPEPASLSLLALGLGALIQARRKSGAAASGANCHVI